MSHEIRTRRGALALFSALASSAVAQHRKLDEKEVIRYERQEITVPDFPAKGYILDIGGGGEAVIGQLKANETIAVDLIKR